MSSSSFILLRCVFSSRPIYRLGRFRELVFGVPSLERSKPLGLVQELRQQGHRRRREGNYLHRILYVFSIVDAMDIDDTYERAWEEIVDYILSERGVI